MFEMMIIDPVTYKPRQFNIFRNLADLEATKAYNEIGSFSFSVKSDFVDFETAITTPNGQGQVMIYANGKPYLHGVIDSYTPNDNGFIDVECTEILQLLKDDVVLGELKLSNFIGEYVPPKVGSTTTYDDYVGRSVYFSMAGPSYFYVAPHNFNGQNMVQVVETADGLTTQANNDLGQLQTIYPKWLVNTPQDYKMTMNTVGYLRYFGFTGVQKTSTADGDVGTAPDGVLMDLISPSLGQYTMRILAKIGNTPTYVASYDFPTYVPGTNILVHSALGFGDVTYRFEYSDTPSAYVVSVYVTLSGEGYKHEFSLTNVSVDKSLYSGAKSGSAFFAIQKGTVVKALSFERSPKQTYATWLETVEGPINFVLIDSSLGEKWTWKLAFTDTDRWQVVSRLLELMETATLHYVGIEGGRPTYYIYNYELLSTAYKFADSSEVFNVSYEKDFSDTFNVLIARAELEENVNGKIEKTNYEYVIQPSPERPNRLGRLRKRIMNPSGITDLATLTTWALAVYEEHSYPEEPVDFQTFITDFWLDVKLGQYVTVHGLLQGKTITEQVNKVNISFSSGMMKVELARRLTLKSALIEARLQNN
ncbi:hypothetical protein [Deinococcus ficus]|uniref:hypothetical protein n=1 Tax=Deinococcus ficus TaxID=317577 RepID=UPI000408C42A|nr:hypothetical protein [Deinococcus ficus]